MKKNWLIIKIGYGKDYYNSLDSIVNIHIVNEIINEEKECTISESEKFYDLISKIIEKSNNYRILLKDSDEWYREENHMSEEELRKFKDFCKRFDSLLDPIIENCLYGIVDIDFSNVKK